MAAYGHTFSKVSSVDWKEERLICSDFRNFTTYVIPTQKMVMSATNKCSK